MPMSAAVKGTGVELLFSSSLHQPKMRTQLPTYTLGLIQTGPFVQSRSSQPYYLCVCLITIEPAVGGNSLVQ